MSISVLNTDSNMTAKTVVTAENADTITGLKTFDRDPSAPFAVSSSSAVVPNLDADKVDGLDAVNWTSFTPTWTSVTVGNGTSTGKYAKLGNVVWFKIDLILGSGSSITGVVLVAPPVTAALTTSHTVAHGEAIDLSTGDAFGLHGRLSSSTTIAVMADNGTKLVGVTNLVPFTWTNPDELHLVGTYEAT